MHEIIELDTRAQNILTLLLNAQDYISNQQMAAMLNVSKRSIYYDLNKINDVLKELKCQEVHVERGKGFYLSDEQKNILRRYLDKSKLKTFYQYSPNERISIIICALIGYDTILTIEQLMDFCHVSRNTVISDLKIAKNELENYGLNLSSIRYTGYIVKGDSLKRRAVFFYHFNLISTLYKKGHLHFIKSELVIHYFDRLKLIEHKLETRYVEGTLLGLAVLLSLKDHNHPSVSFKGYEITQIVKTKEFNIIKKMFPELDRPEIIYISLHLLGSRIQIVPEFTIANKQDEELYSLSKSVINEFERIACIEFSDRDAVQKSIFAHIKTSIYRYRYGIQIDNPITKQISTNYPELYEVTRRVAGQISRSLGVPLPDSEIAYLTLHFGGHLEAAQHRDTIINAILFCQDGISTIKLLQKEIETLIPNIELRLVTSFDELQSLQFDCDVVISTEELLITCPVLRISPILKDEDKTMLVSNLSRSITSNLNQSMWDGLFKIISQYVSPTSQTKLRSDFFRYIKERSFEQKFNKISISPSILEVLSPHNIQLFDKEVDWKESIRLSSSSLLSESKISDSYVETMLSNIINNGPYIYFEPGLAIAHSRPEDGVFQLGLSMGVFGKGVSFNDELVANIVLVLAPIDQKAHLRLLKEIMDIFATREYFDRIIKAKSSIEVYDILALALDEVKVEDSYVFANN